MSELRKDPVIGRWVIIATDRARRPSDFRVPPAPPAGGLCPLCPGNESLTPPELLTVRRDAPGWSVRVVPNKFPALRIEGELRREGEGLYDRMAGIGAHEVIVETRHHDRGFGDLPAAELEDVLWAWSERIRDLSRDQRFRYVMVFKNHGPAAGASLEHPHSQLIALPIVPRYVSEEMDGALGHFKLKERCIYCDIVRQEGRDRVRLVAENEEAVALAPWAPKAPFETWILPRRHASRFEHEPRSVLRAAAELLRSTVRRLDVALERPPYNLMLHTTPLREGDPPHYHWHLELVPTIARVAGFEWGSGFFINPVPPEEAAAFLRKIPDDE